MGTLPLSTVPSNVPLSKTELENVEEDDSENEIKVCLDAEGISRPLSRRNKIKTFYEAYRYYICTVLFLIQSVILISVIYGYHGKKETIHNGTETSRFKEKFKPILHNEETNLYKGYTGIANCVQDKNPVVVNLPTNNNITRFMPGWEATAKDFCHGSEYELLIADDQILSILLSQEIACPEKIASLEISTMISIKDIVGLLRRFCRVRALTFIGAEVCEDSNEKPPGIRYRHAAKTNSLISMRFEQLNDCSTLYENLVHTIWAPNLQTLEFKCVGFTDSDFNVLSNFISLSTSFQTITCSDSNLCENVQFNVNRNLNINILTGRISC